MRLCLFSSVQVVSLVMLAGCGSSKPELTEVNGVVLLGGNPLPNAEITLIPVAGAEPDKASLIAVTDDHGKFQITTNGKPGAAPGDYLVIVAEGPMPEELRDENLQDKASNYRATQKNRPIPAKYSSAAKSDLKMTISKDQKDYKLELSR